MLVGFAKRDIGFTLLEVLLVLVMVAGMVAVVVPNAYNSLSGAQLVKSTRQLASSLRKLRSQAIQTSRSTALTLDVDQRRYQLVSLNETVQLPQDFEIGLLTGARLLVGDGEGVILFYADGSSSGGQINLQRGEQAFQIDVNWLTGEVTIQNDED